MLASNRSQHRLRYGCGEHTGFGRGTGNRGRITQDRDGFVLTTANPLMPPHFPNAA